MHNRPHTDDARARIADGQRRAHAERRRADDYAAIRSAIYALEAAPTPTPALVLLYHAASRIAPDVERPRWAKRLEAVAAGRRYFGDDLVALETIRAARTPADLLNEG